MITAQVLRYRVLALVVEVSESLVHEVAAALERDVERSIPVPRVADGEGAGDEQLVIERSVLVRVQVVVGEQAAVAVELLCWLGYFFGMN
jgi:hypothetical protein